jgi:hypothetical protein
MKFFFLLFTVFYSFNVFAQQPKPILNAARFGTNLAFFGAGDLYGVAIYGEYVVRLNKILSISPRISSGFASRADFDQLTSFATSVSLGVQPFKNKSLQIDIGGLYHKVINTYGSLGEFQYWQYEIERGYHSNENLFGFLGSISGNVYSNKKLEVGIRFDLFTSFNEGYFEADSWQIGTYIGFKH